MSENRATLDCVPKIVDHDARRAELVDACWRIISRQGIAGATTREIAKEAGVAHGILAHYFSDKDEILRAALRRAFERLAAHIQARVAGLSGAAALRTALIEALPIDQERLMGAQVQLAFWGRAVGDPTVIAEQRGSYEIWRTTVQDLVKDACAVGEMPGSDDPVACADVLVALIDGLVAEAALYPKSFSIRRQTRIVDNLLRTYGVDVAAARPGAWAGGGGSHSTQPSLPDLRPGPGATRRRVV